MHLTRAGLPGVVVPTVLVPDARGRIARLFRAFRRV